jgi:hypothetical protein
MLTNTILYEYIAFPILKNRLVRTEIKHTQLSSYWYARSNLMMETTPRSHSLVSVVVLSIGSNERSIML